MEQLEGNEAGPEPELEAFDEDEVKEVLATMVRERGERQWKEELQGGRGRQEGKGTGERIWSPSRSSRPVWTTW